MLTQTIILFQDTSLVYAIGAYALLKGFEVAGKNFNRPVETYLAAAQALGMTYPTTMAYVVLPQAFRNMLPVLLTQTIILFQDTSLVYAIGAYDLLHGFEVAGKNNGRPVESYLAAAVLYFIVCFALSNMVKRLQKKIAIVR